MLFKDVRVSLIIIEARPRSIQNNDTWECRISFLEHGQNRKVRLSSVGSEAKLQERLRKVEATKHGFRPLLHQEHSRKHFIRYKP